MNITSFNVTDVAYHYVALRVLDALRSAKRDEQIETVTRNILKYARDNALRLLLPEPRGNFETASEKVCAELVHFGYAQRSHGSGYELTTQGLATLNLLNHKRFRELRREMVRVHLKTFDNLRKVVDQHIQLGSIYSPIVEAGRFSDQAYLVELLKPTFGDDAPSQAADVLATVSEAPTAKQLESALRARILRFLFNDPTISVPLFRSMTDRLISLRLLNVMKWSGGGAECDRSYSPCDADGPQDDWHAELDVHLTSTATYRVFISEPDLENDAMQRRLLASLDAAFATLPSQAGYFDLPDVRDFVCDRLRIPEAAFDEGVNVLLDQPSPAVTVGLTYDRISGRRKPMVRMRHGNTQVFNLIRRG
jgi:hypothetical protein